MAKSQMGGSLREENPMKEYRAIPEWGGRPASGGPGEGQGVEPQLRMGGVAPGGHGLWELFAVLAKAKRKLSRSASCTCPGNPCYGCGSDSSSGSGLGSGSGSNSASGCGSGCGSGTDSSRGTAHSGPDAGGGAAGSHPQGAGEREPPRGLGQDGAGSQVHAASAHPQLLPNRGIDDILEDQVEPEGKSRTPRFGGGGG